jgi:hypothetical protein
VGPQPVLSEYWIRAFFAESAGHVTEFATDGELFGQLRVRRFAWADSSDSTPTTDEPSFVTNSANCLIFN